MTDEPNLDSFDDPSVVFDASNFTPGDPHSLNTNTINARFGVMPEELHDDPAIHQLKTVHSALKSGIRKIGVNHLKQAADDNEWPKKRREASFAFAERATTSIERQYEDAQVLAVTRRVEIIAEIESSLEGANSADRERSKEIRDALRSMPNEERHKLVNSLGFDSRQGLEIGRALAQGVELTTGVNEQTLERIRGDYLKASQPDKWALVNSIDRALEIAEQGRKAFENGLKVFHANAERTIPDLVKPQRIA